MVLVGAFVTVLVATDALVGAGALVSGLDFDFADILLRTTIPHVIFPVVCPVRTTCLI